MQDVFANDQRSSIADFSSKFQSTSDNLYDCTRRQKDTLFPPVVKRLKDHGKYLPNIKSEAEITRVIEALQDPGIRNGPKLSPSRQHAAVEDRCFCSNFDPCADETIAYDQHYCGAGWLVFQWGACQRWVTASQVCNAEYIDLGRRIFKGNGILESIWSVLGCDSPGPGDYRYDDGTLLPWGGSFSTAL